MHLCPFCNKRTINVLHDDDDDDDDWLLPVTGNSTNIQVSRPYNMDN